MRLPRAWDGSGYNRRLHPASMSIHLSATPLSTVNMRLRREEALEPLQLVHVTAPDGTEGVYRVQSVSFDAMAHLQTAYLEHGACTLGDEIISADGKTDGIEITGTISNVVTTILHYQTRWAVGTIECTDTIYLNIGGETPMDALTEMMQSIPEYILEFEQRTDGTWVVNVRARPTVPVCEGRLGRNLQSCEIDYDVQSMVTRVTAEKLGSTDSNVARYGVHEQVISFNENLTEAQKRRLIAAKLAAYDHPLIGVSISGVELSQVTGLAIDRFTLGTVCRLAIPKFGVTVDELITEKDYADAINKPEDVSVKLANGKPDLSLSVASINKRVGGAGRRIQQQEQQLILNRADIEKSNTRLLLWASTAEWDALAQQYQSTHASALSITSGGISAVAAGSGVVLDQYGRPVLDQDGNPTFDPNNPKNLYSKLNVEKARITAEVRARENDVTSLQSSLMLKANSASLSTVMDSNRQVTAASIATAINAQGSQAAINADKVILSSSGGSTVTLSDKTTVLGLMQVQNGALYVDGAIHAVSGTTPTQIFGKHVISGDNTLQIAGATSGSIDVNAATMRNVVKEITLTDNGDNTYTMTWTNLNGDTTTRNFNRAASVTPTLTGAWSNGVYTVTSDPAAAAPNTTTLFDLGLGTATKGTGSTVEATFDIGYAAIVSGQQVRGGSTGKTGTLSLNVSGLLQSKTVTPSWSQRTVSPDSGKLGLSSVTVSAASVTNTVSAVTNPQNPLGTSEWYGNVTVTPSLNGVARSTSDTFLVDVTAVYGKGHEDGVSDGISQSLDTIVKVTPDSNKNHAGRFWNCIITTSGGQSKLLETNQSTTGLIFDTNNISLSCGMTGATRDVNDYVSKVTINVSATAKYGCVDELTGPFKDDGGNSSVEMFYYYQGERKSAGRYSWYHRASDMQPRLMYV